MTSRILPAYLALAVIWGASFLFMKVALDDLSPLQVVLGRLTLGSLALIAIMTAARRRWPREPRLWAHLAVVAVLLCVVPFLLFAWAGQYLPSGLSSIYNATTPVMAVLAAAVMVPAERMSGGRLIGIGIGALGVVLVVGPWRLGADLPSVPAQLACLAATASYGIAFAYLRRFVTGHGYDAPTIAATQVTIAAVVTAVLTLVVGWRPVEVGVASGLSLLALGVLGTGIAYIWNTMVITGWGPQLASTVTYLTPLVGVVLGETLDWNEPVGGLVVIVGILVSQGRLAFRRRASPVS